MKKYSKVLIIIFCVTLLLSTFVISASADAPYVDSSYMYEPQPLQDLQVGDSLNPGWYILGVINGNSSVIFDVSFNYTVAGVTYNGQLFEFDYDLGYLAYSNTGGPSSSNTIQVWNSDIDWLYDDARLIYIDSCYIGSEEVAEFLMNNLYYLGDSLVVEGAEPEGWYNSLYNLIVQHIYGGGTLTEGQEFSAGVVATVISILAFMLPVIIVFFVIKFLFAWRI